MRPRSVASRLRSSWFCALVVLNRVPTFTTRPQPLGQALALQFALAQALVVPWWDLALAQGSTKAWHALVVPWLTEIHQG